MTETTTVATARKKRGLSLLAPLVLGAAAIGAGASYGVQAYLAPSQEHGLVTFDTVRYINARRAAALEMMGADAAKAEEAVSTLARVDRGVAPAIEEIAAGRLVLVRQALVLDGTLPDITDDVLNALGLPLDVTTIDPKIATEPVSRYSQTPLYEFAEDFVEEGNRRAREEIDKERREGFNELLP